jgi:coenzyme F420 hydrogenase subunit beta
MASTPPGYNRPVGRKPISADAERTIAGACPGAVVAPWGSDAAVHPYWGRLRQVLTGYALDETTRFEGSSGGAISGLLIHALKTGLVDRVLHIAPDPADPTRNVAVMSRSAEEVLSRAGSRYTASSPLEHIEGALAEGGAMAFVGKPCDASALRQLARFDERVGRHVPLVLSFFCGGIPSHAGVGRILQTMGVDPAEVREFRFRGRGWPGNAAATTADRTVEMSYADSWGGHLSREVQFRCKICPDAVGGVADIACADAWYGDGDGYPSFEEQAGRSLIVTRTEVGDRLLESAEPLNPDEIEKMQPSQARRKRLILSRMLALPVTLQPWPRMARLQILRAAAQAGFGEQLKNLLGTVRRTLAGRRSAL